MSNLLLTAANWTDSGSNSPPSFYADGGYDIASAYGVYVMSLNVSASDGDVIGGTLAYTGASSNIYLNYVDSSSETVSASIPLLANVTGESQSFSFAATAGRFVLSYNPDGTDSNLEDAFTATITATVVALGDPYVIRGTHRAYMGLDTAQTAWIRSEEGPLDLTAATLIQVEIAHPSGYRPLLTLDATGTSEGELSFTVTASGARTRLRPGIFYMRAVADGVVIYTALLEVLG